MQNVFATPPDQKLELRTILWIIIHHVLPLRNDNLSPTLIEENQDTNMKNKTCLITGANSGIGKQAAIQLARLGIHVFVGARNRKRGEDAVDEIKKNSGSKNVDLLEIDMSAKTSIHDAANELSERLEALGGC